MRTTLTKRIVANAAPQDRPYELRDLTMKGLILRVQPSGYKAWIVEWARGKRRTLGAAGHLSLDEARAQALHAMSEALQQRLPSVAAVTSAGMSLERFLDERYTPWAKLELKGGEDYSARIRASFPALLSLPLERIDEVVVERWWQSVLTQPLRNTGKPMTKVTASRNLACLRAAMSRAVEWKLLATNPLLGMRNKTIPSRKVVRFLSADEEARIRRMLAKRDGYMIAARKSGNLWRKMREEPLYPEIPADGFGDHLSPVVLLAMNTGLRRGELLKLEWRDIDLATRMLTVRAENAKSGLQRFVPLNNEAHDVLVRWKRQRGGEGAVFGISDAKTAWSRLLDDAGVKDFRFHDLRHHFASRLVRAGVDLNTVRELLGHADIKMTLRYAHLCPETLAAAVAKLAA